MEPPAEASLVQWLHPSFPVCLRMGPPGSRPGLLQGAISVQCGSAGGLGTRFKR
jgi:hypothetical protein